MPKNNSRNVLQHPHRKLYPDFVEKVQVRIPVELHSMAKSVAGRLRITLEEFLRRAVSRELAYNQKKVSNGR